MNFVNRFKVASCVKSLNWNQRQADPERQKIKWTKKETDKDTEIDKFEYMASQLHIKLLYCLKIVKL